jgi:hypothetical protein
MVEHHTVAVGVGSSILLVRLARGSLVEGNSTRDPCSWAGATRLDNLSWLCPNCHYLIHHFADEREAFMAGREEGLDLTLEMKHRKD